MAVAVEINVSYYQGIDLAIAKTVDNLGQIDILINIVAIFTAAPKAAFIILTLSAALSLLEHRINVNANG